MLFTLGLLLLLTPLSSSQTSEKRNSTGSDLTKPNTVLTLSKPKTSSAPAKPPIRPTLKAVNQTAPVLPSATQKAKVKLEHTVRTTASPPVKPTTTIPAVAKKEKQLVNQTVAAKAPQASEAKVVKDKRANTSNAQSASAKSASKTTKFQPSLNQTVSVKAPSTSDGKAAKQKAAPTVVQNAQSTSAKSAPATSSKTTKNKPTASVNQTVVAKPVDAKKSAPTVAPTVSTPVKAAPSAAERDHSSADASAVTKAPAQPIKVVIADDCESSKSKEHEVTIKPGSPLVMTHKISLMPGGCSGNCDAEMSTLKDRVARLEREMASFKEKCSCSVNCPNDCSGNGECEKGRCICQQGFVGHDCSKCKPGADCSKKTTKEKGKVETTVPKGTKDGSAAKSTVQEKSTKVEQTVEKKDQKKGTDAKETDTKSKDATVVKSSAEKKPTKQDTSENKTILRNSTKTGSGHDAQKEEDARKGRTTTSAPKKVPQITSLKNTTVSKSYPKSDHLKDEPQVNVTQADAKKTTGGSKVVTVATKVTGTNKTSAGKVVEQSTITEESITQASGSKQVKKESGQSVVERNVAKTGNEKSTVKVQSKVDETVTSTAEEARTDKTTVQGSVTKKTGGSGLGSVKVENISSYSFTVTWSAPQGMFKNFTVIRKESRTGGVEEDHEEFEVETKAEAHTHTEVTKKVVGTTTKADTRRVSMVVTGSVRSVEFSSLLANTRYVIFIYGNGAERRSKIHRAIVTTGPEPATEMVFTNVTESSLTVSWNKPKGTFTGFRVTYTHIVTGETRSVIISGHQSYSVLSKLAAGSSYIVTVTSTLARAQSDVLASLITTVPAPPTHLQAVNVTDTKAVLQWTASLGKVDRFIITYESSKTPNVTVTVMLSGNSVEHQLRGLQRGTLYTVRVMSQKDSLQSAVVSTTFTTANVVKASEVGARSALIVWKTTTVVYHTYRIIYQVAGEETKELMILDPTVTEYTLTGLVPMSRYIVLVQGERDGRYTSIVTTEFITGKVRFPFPTDCSQELLNGALQSGEVEIYPQGKDGPAVRVYCDMEADGGGWTVFQRRMNGKTDFFRSWSEYRAGFGNLSEEFWLGNELLHNLSNIGPVSLRVDMRSGNDSAYAHYADFSVDSEERFYTLTVSGYTGTAGDSMRYHNGRPFSSRDKDTDSLGIHCARAYMGGWWYKNCYKTNLNGLYGSNVDNQGVVWIDWKGKDSSIPFTEMKFRPSRFSPATLG